MKYECLTITRDNKRDVILAEDDTNCIKFVGCTMEDVGKVLKEVFGDDE